MSAVTTRTPHGTVWRLRVLWQPRWRPLVLRYGGWRRPGRGDNPFTGVEVPDLGDGPDYAPLVRRPELLDRPRASALGDSKLLLALVVIVLVLGGAVVWWLLLPLVLLVVDVLVLAALVLVGLPLRLLLGRAWTVEATSAIPSRTDDGPSPGTLFFTTRVPGWRAAHRRRDEIAAQLAHGKPAQKISRLRIRA